jgi:tRNA threonylcarbamoyladenosine biosynthesis protein TsaE
MATFISRNPEQTLRLGEQWGREAGPGWVICLIGDLGAGKTQLVKGLARGLGASDLVHSPSYALINIYNGGRLSLFHIDLYRLDNREQIISAGLEEFLCRPAGVTAVEWGERWFGPRPDGGIDEGGVSRVTFEVLSETERRISYEDTGA